MSKSADYKIYDVQIDREYDSGKVVVPSSDASAGTVVLQAHSPIEYKIVTYHIASEVDWPDVPSPESFSASDFTLMESKETSKVPIPNGISRLYEVFGYYVFLKTVAEGPGIDFLTGRCPWDDGPLSQMVMKKANYNLDILMGKPADQYPILTGIANI